MVWRSSISGGRHAQEAPRRAARRPAARPGSRRGRSLTLRQRNWVEVLLRAGGGDTDAEIAEALGISTNTVASVRGRFAGEVVEAAVTERPRSGAPANLDGKQEAAIIALASSPTDDGQARWSVRRLSQRAVAMEVVE